MRTQTFPHWIWPECHLVILQTNLNHRALTIILLVNSSYPSTVVTNETVLLSAHYDSRGSFGSLRAPGGDDDGSGTIALLSIARAIAQNSVTFKKNVQLCTFAGEEQGLLGSRAYAGMFPSDSNDARQH